MEAKGWRPDVRTVGRSIIGMSEQFRLATLPFHVNGVLTSFIAYNGILHVIAPALSKALIPKRYAEFPERSRINWRIRLASFTQATLVCIWALRIIFTDQERRSATRDDRLWAYSPSVGTLQAHVAGYFFWDVLISVQYFDILGLPSFMHGICALAITLLGFRPFGNYYGVNFILYELSTPFLNIHWVLDKLDMTGSNLQFYNGICLMASFFGCRILWGGYQTWLMSSDIISAWRDYVAGSPYAPQLVLENGMWHHPFAAEAMSEYNFPKYLLGTYLVANTILTGLNFYWFGLMIKAMRKRFTDKKTKKDE